MSAGAETPSEPFSRVLVWCLVGPYAAYLALPVLEWFIAFISGGGRIKGLIGWLMIVAGLVQLGAVGVAAKKLIWDPRYRNSGNYVLFALGAAPFVVTLVGMVVAVIVNPNAMRIHF